MKNYQYSTNQRLNAVDGGKAFSLLIIFYILFTTVISAMLQLIPSIEPFDATILSTCSPLAIFTLLFAYKNRKSIKFTSELKVKSFDKIFIPITVFLAVGVLFAFGTINELVAKFILKLGGKVESSVVPVGDAWVFIISIIVFCVLPAIAEELFFRGLLLTSVKSSNKIWGVISVSLCFALYHGNATQIVFQFIYGVILCLLTLSAKSIMPAIITHFLNNFLVLAFLQFNISINLGAWWIILIGVIITTVSLFFIIKKMPKNNGSEKLKGFYIPYALLGLAVCLTLIITGVIL